MPIELKFVADSTVELMEQIWLFAQGSTNAAQARESEGKEANQARKAFAATHVKKRSVKAVMEEQAPPPQEVFEQEDPIVEEVMVDETAATNGTLSSAKALLDLKARMLTTLQAAIAEGKIDKLRAILHTHGGGAKSFPEVAPQQFVEIEKAVQEGALA